MKMKIVVQATIKPLCDLVVESVVEICDQDRQCYEETRLSTGSRLQSVQNARFSGHKLTWPVAA